MKAQRGSRRVALLFLWLPHCMVLSMPRPGCFSPSSGHVPTLYESVWGLGEVRWSASFRWLCLNRRPITVTLDMVRQVWGKFRGNDGYHIDVLRHSEKSNSVPSSLVRFIPSRISDSQPDFYVIPPTLLLPSVQHWTRYQTFFKPL
jgi:hypothetical protein